MKRKSILFFVILLPLVSISQIVDNFSDGNFTSNPAWNGITDNFWVNSNFQLQSKATTTSKSYLTTTSEAFENATWEAWVKINYIPTSSNYASIYIISDRTDISGDFNGYFVQVGHNTSKDIALYVQKGSTKTKIIDGINLRANTNPCEIKIKVTRDYDGNFALYSKLPDETDFVLEGTTMNDEIQGSKYFGLLYSNSSTTGNAYYFDDIKVTGEKLKDTIPPTWETINITGTNQLTLTFSEAMNLRQAQFFVDNEMGGPNQTTISSDSTQIILNFNSNFEKGKLYTVTIKNAFDLEGNALGKTQKQIGIAEQPTIGDLIINEVCFNAAEDGAEYFELYNTSEKVIDLSTILFTTRKTDGTLNSGYLFPVNSLILPDEFLAITTDVEAVKNTYLPPDTANIISSDKWYALNNSGGNLLITNSEKDTIYDEIEYNEGWHHQFINENKGVSLEKINPLLSGLVKDSWHSAASEVNYGTPGYKNSQYRALEQNTAIDDNWIWADPESFSPDNDGINDVCLLHYTTDENGCIANAHIFNPVGVKVKDLLSNQLLSSEGVITWDGTNNNGRIVNSGVYVLLIEVVNPTLNTKKIKKLPIVVSIR